MEIGEKLVQFVFKKHFYLSPKKRTFTYQKVKEKNEFLQKSIGRALLQ